MRGRSRPAPVLAAPLAGALVAALAAGCVTATRELGSDPHEAAARGGWGTSEGRPPAPEGEVQHPAMFDPPKRGPDEIAVVPAAAYAPVDSFFDNEGYLVGDRVEIDCSFEPFGTRLVGPESRDEGHGRWIVREEGHEGDVRWVRLRNGAGGVAYQQEKIPTATFGSHSEPPPLLDPATGKVIGVNPHPVFEFVGTEEVLVRFHMTSPPDRPVWFRARAVGTPSTLRPEEVRNSIYVNANRRRRVEGPELGVSLDVHRKADGTWAATVDDPGTASPGGEGR